jgi:hypothetical protein
MTGSGTSEIKNLSEYSNGRIFNGIQHGHAKAFVITIRREIG